MLMPNSNSPLQVWQVNGCFLVVTPEVAANLGYAQRFTLVFEGSPAQIASSAFGPLVSTLS